MNWTSRLIIVGCLLAYGTIAALILSRVLETPVDPRIIEVDAVSWSMTRPADWLDTRFVDLDDVILNSYTSGGTTVKFAVAVFSLARDPPHYESWQSWSLWVSHEALSLAFNVTVDASDGFVDSLLVRFDTVSSPSSVDIAESPDRDGVRNVEVLRIFDSQGEYFVDAQATDRPESCMLKMYLTWVLGDLNTVDQTMVATLEATYFNGTAYEQAIIPIELNAFAFSE